MGYRRRNKPRQMSDARRKEDAFSSGGALSRLIPRPGILCFSAEAATHRLRRSRMRGRAYGALAKIFLALARLEMAYDREEPQPHAPPAEKCAR